MPETAFGIDFGTTNTRVAYFDGTKPIMVPVEDRGGRRFYEIPSVVGYLNGEPISFGHDAIDNDAVTSVKSIKWQLDRENPIDLGKGYWVESLNVAEAFFRYLRDVVKNSELQERNLSRASITVPVNFPYRSRENLCKACENAGIEVAHIFQEPVAALYCQIARGAHSSTAAVFYWGGGTLDVATVQVGQGWAQVKVQDGLRVGGDNFDRIIGLRALMQFLADYPDIRRSPEELLEDPQRGPKILQLAENVKRRLGERYVDHYLWGDFLPNRNIMCDVRREDFEAWIEQDIERGIACLKRAIRRTGVPDSMVNPILLSGGTCHIPLIQQRLLQEFGPTHIRRNLPFAEDEKDYNPVQDISNATAIGAALLAVFGAEPVFSSDLGIRTADATTSEDGFYPVFRKGSALEFGKKHERFFVSNPSMGVARVLICDRLDPDLQPQGLLRRIVPIPIDRKESWIDVYFELTRHLGLKVYGSGEIRPCEREETETFIHDLNLGFKIPELAQEAFLA